MSMGLTTPMVICAPLPQHALPVVSAERTLVAWGTTDMFRNWMIEVSSAGV